MKKSLLVGICATRKGVKYARFRDSMAKLTDSLTDDYCIGIFTMSDTFLPDAQNTIAEKFIEERHDLLLLLDDDHWGHTKEMFECLVRASAPMATIKTYSRHYPYSCALMRKDKKTYYGIENGKGYMDCDMTGFPMTLIKREVFERLDRPYFRPTKGDARPWTTDKDFCQRLIQVGITPVGCFQHCLPHDDITQENVMERRYRERNKNNNIALYNLFNNNQKKQGDKLCTVHQ